MTPLAPVSFRLPRPGETDPYFGVRRGFWFELILPNSKNNFTPAVKSKLIKKPGAKRGVRLIDFSSARAWFEAQDPDGPPDGPGLTLLAA